MRTALAEADVVVCPSRATEADVRGRLRYRGRVEVVPHGIDREVFYPEPEAELEQRPYLLWVGRRDWYRDFEVAVEAVRRLRRDDPTWLLRVAGDSETGESWPEWVRFEGTVGEARLRRLYSSARGVAYLSRSEGFGLPILEAQACGCAVICYREPACRETAGSGARFVEMGDAAGVAAAVRGDRGGLVEKGFENCGGYSWERAVERLAGVYGAV